MKKFNDLTIRGQKMRIVRDAITRIRIGKIIPRDGTYLRFIDDNIPKRSDMQKLLQEGSKCEACAKGALFTACVLNVNGVKFGDEYADERYEKKKLQKWFSAGELDTIECAFECEIIRDTEGILIHDTTLLNSENTSLAKKAIAFGRRFKNDRNRLLGILKNILKNGRFKP